MPPNNSEILNIMMEKGRKRAREDQKDTIETIVKKFEQEFLSQTNCKNIGWNRQNASQVFYRERKKNYPALPKTIDEYDSSKGRDTSETDLFILFDDISTLRYITQYFRKSHVVAFGNNKCMKI